MNMTNSKRNRKDSRSPLQHVRKVSLCFLLALLPSCTESAGEIISKQEPTRLVGGMPTESRSVVETGNFTEGEWKETVLPSHESLTAVQFTTTMSGWVASASGSLYRTSDGGTNWKRVDVGNEPGNYLVSLSFVGDKLGWAVFSNYPSNYSDYKAYNARILHTKDGGNSWSTQYEQPQASINKIHFNQDEGWALGLSYKSSRSSSHYLLHTADQGKHWEDLSEQFASALNGSAVNDFATDLYSSHVREATVMTVAGRVVRSIDGGRNWLEIGRVKDEFEQTGFIRIGELAEGKVWVLGGADSREGIWANLTSLSKDNSPIMYRTTQVFFRDTVFLTAATAIACGTVPEYQNPKEVTEKRSAIIAFSPNGARNWSILYRSAKARTLNALYVVDENKIWAVGENGLIVLLTKT